MAYDRSTKLRNHIFMWSTLSFGLVAGLNDFYDWIDECLLAYALISGLCVISLFLASWWRLQVDKISDVLRWLMVMIFGIGLTNFVQLYARWLFVTERPEYEGFITSTLWHYRMAPQGIALTYMASLILARMIYKDYHGDR